MDSWATVFRQIYARKSYSCVPSYIHCIRPYGSSSHAWLALDPQRKRTLVSLADKFPVRRQSGVKLERKKFKRKEEKKEVRECGRKERKEKCAFLDCLRGNPGIGYICEVNTLGDDLW